MYDRAPRSLTKAHGCTAEHVGPGSYDSKAPRGLNQSRADGYAPFLSMTTRDSFLNPTDTVIAAPGPGQYDPGLPQGNVKGGRTLANKTSRFKEGPTTAAETPGPGSYSLSKESDWIKDQRKANSAPGGEGKGGGMLMTDRIKFSRKPAAPSIPTPGQAYGYEETDDGTLKKQDSPDKDKSMGPAYYNVDRDDTQTAKTYKGIHFGRMTSRRMDFSGKDGPGPGEYEPYVEGAQSVVTAENVNIKGADRTKYDARLPRYHELVTKDEEKKAVPGPGKYEIKGTFDNSAPKVNTEGIEVEHPPFGSQAKRFDKLKIQTPAPGTYNDPRTALESQKRITGLKRSPFSQTSTRFTHDGVHKTPGPGSYNVPGLGSQSLRKAYIESTRRGAFGTTSVRIAPITKKSEPEAPGPAQYQVPEKPTRPRYKQPSSNFASLSNRLTETPAAVRDLPPPGSYEVQRSYANTQGKVVPGQPRSVSGRRKQGAFQSSASRFAPPRDVVLAETDPSYPGPGSYNPRLKGQKGNPMVTKDQRFNQKKSDMPGPGTYEYSPLIQDTVLKGTFNATLNNPIMARINPMGGATSTTSQPFLLGV